MAVKSCDICKHFTTGPALNSSGEVLTKSNGEPWFWKDCAKMWGKPLPDGVFKNVCGVFIPKENT